MHLGNVTPGLTAIFADKHASVGMVHNPSTNNKPPWIPCVRENVIDAQIIAVPNLTKT